MLAFWLLSIKYLISKKSTMLAIVEQMKIIFCSIEYNPVQTFTPVKTTMILDWVK